MDQQLSAFNNDDFVLINHELSNDEESNKESNKNEKVLIHLKNIMTFLNVNFAPYHRNTHTVGAVTGALHAFSNNFRNLDTKIEDISNQVENVQFQINATNVIQELDDIKRTLRYLHEDVESLQKLSKRERDNERQPAQKRQKPKNHDSRKRK